MGTPPGQSPDTSIFKLLNQGKRSIALNMRSAETAGILRALAREADVLIENYREGVLDALGLGYGDLAMENPEMVYVSMRGFSGKNSKKAGHDLIS
jgi:crotonobetainyl-CoA:carnitine CoA-transferase CaiB-like acyl-CoA transferase